MPKPFELDDFQISETLGEGAYGKVKLATSVKTNEKYALKIIQLKYVADLKDLKKEIAIHRNVDHPNIIKFLGYLQQGSVVCMILEYASSGELFDRIEPDIGLTPDLAHFYLRQLVAGVEYLHTRGIVHRDIKPENLLLDKDHNIKICDFGLSTIFRHNGEERQLSRRCGTSPYIAPEVFAGQPHRAEPTDVWSIGIVLVTMLAGCLPWDEPSLECLEYRQWVDGKAVDVLWEQVSPKAFDLLVRILEPDPCKRATMPDIKKHPWFDRETLLTRCATEQGMLKLPLEEYMALLDISRPRFTNRGLSDLGVIATVDHQKLSAVPGSLVESATCEAGLQNATVQEAYAAPLQGGLRGVSFSQPTYIEDMLLSQELSLQAVDEARQPASLAPRMTRLTCTWDKATIMGHLVAVLAQMPCSHQADWNEKAIKVTATDKRKMLLKFTVKIYCAAPAGNLVDFRRTKGDGLEFKRYFKHIKCKLQEHTESESQSAPGSSQPVSTEPSYDYVVTASAP